LTFNMAASAAPVLVTTDNIAVNAVSPRTLVTGLIIAVNIFESDLNMRVSDSY
jgi:hypothetical protein